MSVTKDSSRRHFTQAARDASVAAKRAKSTMMQDIAAPRVFITRLTSFPMPFGWEIRRFGGLILGRSEMGYPTVALARSAGEKTLAALVPA